MSNKPTSTADEHDESPESSMDKTAIREYHERIRDVLEPLGSVGQNPTLLVNDKMGWYVTRENQGEDYADEEGGPYERERRPRHFEQDYSTVADSRLERTLYALTSYKHPAVFEDWKPAHFDEEDSEYQYRDRKPTPTVEDITALSVWGDIDLADDLKAERPSLGSETYDVAEEAYEAYIDAFAELYGGRDSVYMLDSVGGAYIFGAPEAVLPIARYYENDPAARAWVFNEFLDRSNDYLKAAEQRINEEVEGASEVIHPDWANNINRQYKIPLTLHGDHDAVVTPVDVERVEYREPTPIEDVDEELMENVRQWCEAFTANEFEDRVDDLIAALWPDEYEANPTWGSALDEWVEEQREKEQREEQRRQAAAERRAQRLEDLGDGLEGTPITPFLQDVYDALDGIETAEVVKDYASDEWDSGADMSDKIEFNPSWRSSKSGASCYVNTQTNRFGDPGDNGGGYAAKAMALGKSIITQASDDLVGEDWGEAVDALRDAGYEVPIWTPEKGSRRHDGTTYEKMPYWAVKKAAVALGVVPEDSFVEQTTDEGNTYLGFPGTDSYTNALEAIEEAGLEHGRSTSADRDPGWITEPVSEVDLEPREEVAISDDELIERAMGAGNGDTFRELWEGDGSGYSSPARADLALCSLLAFWTGGDGVWMDDLYRQSGLMREEWDELIGTEDGGPETELSYGDAAVRHALKQKDDFYKLPSQQTVGSYSGDEAETASEVPDTDTTESHENDTASEDLSERHAELEAKIESLKDDLADKESRVDHLQTVMSMREDKIEYLQERVGDLESENDDLKDRIELLRESNPVDEQVSTPESQLGSDPESTSESESESKAVEAESTTDDESDESEPEQESNLGKEGTLASSGSLRDDEDEDENTENEESESISSRVRDLI